MRHHLRTEDIAGARAGLFDPFVWIPLKLGPVEIEVTNAPLRVNGRQLAISHRNQQQIADANGHCLLTPRVARTIHKYAGQIADYRAIVRPPGNTVDQMIDAWIACSDTAGERLSAHPDSLWSNLSKDWVCCPRYGERFISGAMQGQYRAFNYGLFDGSREIQPLGGAHGLHHWDYSQGYRAMRLECKVEGKPALVADVLTDPTYADFLTGEGPYVYVRHPGVPQTLPLASEDQKDFGRLCLEISLREAATVREEGGHNAGPVRKYFAETLRRILEVEQPTGWRPGWDWCAAAFGWVGHRAAEALHVIAPYLQRITVWETVRDARERGALHLATSDYRPRPGDGVVMTRTVHGILNNPLFEGQSGHIGRLLPGYDPSAPTVRTLDGNAGTAWGQTDQPRARIVAWIEEPITLNPDGEADITPETAGRLLAISKGAMFGRVGI